MFSCKGRRKSLRNCGRGMAIRMQPGARRGVCLHDHARGRQGLGGGTASFAAGKTGLPAPRAQGPAPRAFPGRGGAAPAHRRGRPKTHARRGTTGDPALPPKRAPLGRAARAGRHSGGIYRAPPGRGRSRRCAPSSRHCRAAAASAPLRAPAPCGRRPGGTPPPNDTPSASGTRGPRRPRGELLAGAPRIARRPARRSRPREKGAELPPWAADRPGGAITGRYNKALFPADPLIPPASAAAS